MKINMQFNFRLLILLVLIVLGLIRSVHAEKFSLTGSEVYQLCASNVDTNISRCNKYILGVLDGRVAYMSERATLGDSEKFTLGAGGCVYGRSDVTIEGLRLAVKWQVEDGHQFYDKLNGGITVMDAVNRAVKFQCSNSNARTENAPKLYLDGKALNEMCSSKILSDQSDCGVYMIGVLDGRKAYMSEYADAIAASSNSIPELCIYSDLNASLQSLRTALMKKIESDIVRYKSNTVASIAVTEAIRASFDCPVAKS